MAALGLVVVACTSGADAEPGPREVEMVTLFEDPDELSSPDGRASQSGNTDPGDSVDVGDVEVPTVDRSVSSTTTSTPPTTTSSVVTTTSTAVTTPPVVSTLAPPPTEPDVWIVGLLNEDETAPGRAQSFGVGFDAAVQWANGLGAREDDRIVQVRRCAPSSGTTSTACAHTLLDNGVDVVVRGYDENFSEAAPVLEVAAVPVLGGVAVGITDAKATNAALTIGGAPAELAGIAAAVVTRGFGATAVIYDDTEFGLGLIEEFIVPVLEAAGVSQTLVPVPTETLDLAAVLAPVAGPEIDSWIIVVNAELCEPVILARSDYAVTSTAFYWSPCTTAQILGNVGPLMEQSFFTTELVTPLWLDLVSTDFADTRSLAAAVITDIDPLFIDDPDAIIGYLVGSSSINQLRRGGASIENARLLPVPHPLAIGELDCAQSTTYPAICSGDILLAQFFGGSLVGPPQTVNGIRGR